MKVRTNKIVGFVMSLILIMSSMMLSSKVEAAEKMYDVFISSLVKGTTTELAGAKFSIKDETNANVVSWDSTDAPHIAHLKSGRYTLVEDQAPNGYQADVAQIEFLVFDDGSVRIIEGASSSLAPNATIKFNHILVGFDVRISNVSEDNTTVELPGVQLNLSKQSGEFVRLWTSRDTMEVVKLFPDKYRLSVQQGLQGYEPAVVVDFEVAPNGEIYSQVGSSAILVDHVQMVHILSKHDVRISKVAQGQTTELENAKLTVKQITDVETELESWTTTATQKILKLAKGVYKLEETQAPDGYDLAKAITFRVNLDGSVELKQDTQWVAAANATVQMTNTLKKHVVIISSLEEGKPVELPQAQLVIKNKDTMTTVETFTSTNAEKEVMLLPGIYVVEETQAPVGFNQAAPVEFIVGPDSSVHIIVGQNAIEAFDKKVQMIHTLKKYDVHFSSVAKNQNNELQNAKLRVIRKDGVVLDTWQTTSMVKTLSLAPEQYLLEEVEAPNGYTLAAAIEFRVNVDGSVEWKENNQWVPLGNGTVQMIHNPKPKVNPAPVPQPKPKVHVQPIVNEQPKVTPSFHIPKTMDTTDVLIWFTLLFTSLFALAVVLNIQKEVNN